MARSIIYYIIYAIVIVALASALILAFRPKASAPGSSDKQTLSTISETTGELSFGTGSGTLQTNTVNPSHSSSSATSSAQPTTSNGTRTNSSTSTTITPPASTPSNGNTSSYPSTSGSTATVTRPTSPSAKPLVNTGPGDSIALFVGVTTLATFAHMAYRRLQLSKAV